MNSTTIKITMHTKKQLDQFREYKNESYDEVINKIVYITQQTTKQPKLAKEAIRAITKARERIQKGHFITEDEAKRRLGL